MRKALAKLEEVVEVKGVGVVGADAHGAVEDDYALHRGAERKHAVGLVVLLLLANEEHPDARVVDHKLYLLLTARGIERYRDGPDAPRAEVAIHVFDTVLSEHTHILLRLNAEGHQSV